MMAPNSPKDKEQIGRMARPGCSWSLIELIVGMREPSRRELQRPKERLGPIRSGTTRAKTPTDRGRVGKRPLAALCLAVSSIHSFKLWAALSASPSSGSSSACYRTLGVQTGSGQLQSSHHTVSSEPAVQWLAGGFLRHASEYLRPEDYSQRWREQFRI